MSANVGENLKPLSKVASGGELARIMLAMKQVLAQQDGVPTLIFDEVDAGVSGRAAQKVAYKLWTVSKGRQVLCVTHLPQIAAMADAEYTVEKRVENERNVYQRSASGRERSKAGAGTPHWRQHDHRDDACRCGRASSSCGRSKIRNKRLTKSDVFAMMPMLYCYSEEGKK